MSHDPMLHAFRQMADLLRDPDPIDWQWIGPHMSQRMFGISERRATEYAARHGGEARKMDPSPSHGKAR